MAAFLERTNSRARLERYRRLIGDAAAFARGEFRNRDNDGLREHMIYGVLDHARFANAALLSAVVLFQYHVSALDSPDFTHPVSFIKSAETEIGRLNKKKLSDVMRMARLQEMIAERRKILDKLKKQWVEKAAELRRIVLYIRDNLSRIEKLCDTSVVVLAELEIGRQKEKQLIEDVKTYYKVKLKEALHLGKTTKQDIENAKQELDMLTAEISVHAREDADALTRLYEAMHNHIQQVLQKLDPLLAELEKKGGGIQEHTKCFRRIEQVLVSLLSDYRFDVRLEGIHTDAEHAGIVREKRKEMLDYLFEEVQKERRIQKERRSSQDRRKINDPDYPGPERRTNKERRAGKSRRS